jgi:hypothetical protein
MVGGCAVHFQRLGYIGVPSDVEIVCNVGDVDVFFRESGYYI